MDLMESNETDLIKVRFVFKNNLNDLQFLQNLKLEDIRIISFKDNFESVEEVLKFFDESFCKYHKNLLLLLFPFVEDLKAPELFELSSKSSCWGPQVILIKNSVLFFKEPYDTLYKKVSIEIDLKIIEEFVTLRDICNLLFKIYQKPSLCLEPLFVIEDDNFYYSHNLNEIRKYLDRIISDSNILGIRFFLPIVKKFSDSQIFKCLLLATKNKNSKIFLELIERSFESANDEISDYRIRKILSSKDSNNYNLLMIAVKNDNIEVVNFMLHHKLVDVNYTTQYQSSALKIAENKSNFDILFALLQNDAKYKDLGFKPLNLRFKISKLKTLLDDITELHNIIKNKHNTSKIEKIITKYPSMCHFYNSEGESAAAVALKYKKLEIYKFLLKKGIMLGPDEDIKDFLSDNKAEVRNVHRNVLKLPYDDYLIKLMKHCRVGHDVPDYEKTKHNELILRALNKLNIIKEIKTILELISEFNDLHLIFEFNRDTVDQIDPTTGKTTMGVFYLSGWIYIGAKGLKIPMKILKNIYRH